MMLKLIDSLLVAKGGHRHCYEHPDDSTRCVKVLISDERKEHDLEQKYYLVLARRGISWDLLPKYYGQVDTNLGVGAVYDLIKDFDGNVSKTLEYYLKVPDPQELLEFNFRQAFYELRDYLHEQVVISRRINSCNIVYQRVSDKVGRMVVIDNIGNTEFFPISNIIKSVGRKKVARRWQRFEESLLRAYPGNVLVDSILN